MQRGAVLEGIWPDDIPVFNDVWEKTRPALAKLNRYYPVRSETGVGPKAHRSLISVENRRMEGDPFEIVGEGEIVANGHHWWRWFNFPTGYDNRNSTNNFDYLNDTARPSVIRVRNSSHVVIGRGLTIRD